MSNVFTSEDGTTIVEGNTISFNTLDRDWIIAELMVNKVYEDRGGRPRILTTVTVQGVGGNPGVGQTYDWGAYDCKLFKVKVINKSKPKSPLPRWW